MKMQKPKVREIETPSRSSQPSLAEPREEFAMLGAHRSTVREAFFNPIKVNERAKSRR